MADFGDFESSSDPTADFLAREKELLGDDAALFDSMHAGPSGASTGLNLDDDFGDFTDTGASAVAEAAAAFPPVPSVPVIASSPAMPAPSLGSPAPQQSFPPAFSPASPVQLQPTGASSIKYEDSEFISQWREKQAAIIEDRDRKSDEKHQQILERAKRDLEKFYREYNEKKDHMRAKAAKEDRESNHGQVAVEGANVWERVVALADISSTATAGAQSAGSSASGKQARMRQVLAQLKNDPTAPLNSA